MSKATEFVFKLSTRPQLKLPEERSTEPAVEVVAEVADNGRLQLRGNVGSPERALALARWILDTFGEPGDGARGAR